MATTTDEVRGESLAAQRFAAFDAFYFRIESAFNYLAAFFIFGIMMLGVVQVIGRSMFNLPVRGYVDIVEIAITVFAFLAISYCQKLGGHIRMEILIRRFTGRGLWIVEMIGTLVIMLIISILLVYGWDHFLRAWSIGDSSIDVQIPLWPSKFMIPFAFTMLMIRLGIQLVGFARLVAHPDAEHIGVPEIETVETEAEREIRLGLAGDTEGVRLPTGKDRSEAD